MDISQQKMADVVEAARGFKETNAEALMRIMRMVWEEYPDGASTSALLWATAFDAEKGLPFYDEDMPGHSWLFPDGSVAKLADNGSAVY